MYSLRCKMSRGGTRYWHLGAKIEELRNEVGFTDKPPKVHQLNAGIGACIVYEALLKQ